ncbi:hypothetical protein SIN09_16645 [Streptomyces sp. F8]|uniref:hypothetical protein n=1 Tax=Streptomyces sp. F8 TaxID=1436085 RepID=UPI0029CBCE72|nr:hypothetical protein [Streptomyces sp. F8]MDX6761013.1 hypothetical protein [Streptomyces sp. F8]
MGEDGGGGAGAPGRAYTAGSYGCRGSGTVQCTGRAITGTGRQRLFLVVAQHGCLDAVVEAGTAALGAAVGAMGEALTRRARS